MQLYAGQLPAFAYRRYVLVCQPESITNARVQFQRQVKLDAYYSRKVALVKYVSRRLVEEGIFILNIQ